MSFTTIAIEGGLLPNDLLDRLAAGDPGLPGQRPGDFGLKSARLADEIQSAYSDAQRHWAAFQSRYRQAAERGKVSITTVTRESWIEPILERLDYDLQFQRAGIEAGGQSFVISYLAGAEPSVPPVHGVGCDDDLDKRAEKRRSPHSTVQEYLNQSDAVWGIVTNGSKLRLLRHSTRIAKPRFVEFDLAGMMESNVYSEFALFYRLLHRTRLPRSSADAHECWLEKYYAEGVEQGGRVRDRLRDGVEVALKTFGSAFLKHQSNNELRVAITDGRLSAASFYRELLRLVYRMLFLMVAEERRLMFPPDRANDPRQTIFSNYYGVNRLRKLADRYIAPDPEIDLWESLKHSFEILRSDSQAMQLGMAALNGELFGPYGCPNLETACLRNDDLLRAIRALATFEDDGTRRRVNFGALDVEELGSVYESLLDFHPQVSTNPAGFDLVTGSERKTTGSYYTPPELVHELIESALVPVMNERLEAAKSEDAKIAAMLALRIVDPAAGSGHFLLAAARRVGKELARIRSGEEEPAPPDYRHAVRDVIRECIYAVDKNPLAVDLCKVALWIEGHNAGQPLSFLDHHVKCGDSLVGVFDLKVLEAGIPDDAYKAGTGDDKDAAKHYRKLNHETRANQPTLPLIAPPRELTAAFEALSHRDEASPADVEKKAGDYAELRHRPEMARLENACNAWCAAFFAPLQIPQYRGQDLVPTTATVWEILNGRQIYGRLNQEITKAATTYSFFNWPLEFPEVFARNGFDVVLGNPPWERVKLGEKEFFASRAHEIATAQNKTERDRLIRELPKRRPELAVEFAGVQRTADCQGKFLRESNRFPQCGRGDVNTYAIFAEHNRTVLGKHGRAGFIVQSDIATGDTYKGFFEALLRNRELVSLYDFVNTEGLFPDIHRTHPHFCLITISGTPIKSAADFSFWNTNVGHIRDRSRHFSLTVGDVALLNPNTRTCPIFRTKRDAEIAKQVYQRVPILSKDGPPEESPWGAYYLRLVDYGDHADRLFSAEMCRGEGYTQDSNYWVRGKDRRLPVYESKLINAYDHRYATYTVGDSVEEVTADKKGEPSFRPIPRYWIDEAFFHSLISKYDHSRAWFLGYRDITNSTNTRTMLAVAIPRVAAARTLPILGCKGEPPAMCLLANLNSFVLDYFARQSIGGTHMTFSVVKQLATIPPDMYSEPCPWSPAGQTRNWMIPRVLELSFTATDLAFDECGYEGPPFRWDENRRFLIRCELDAAFFHMYGVSREDADYILDTFPIVKRKDEARFGEYRTKRLILEIYDEMERAKQTGVPYQTRLDPPPGDPRAAHPDSKQSSRGAPSDAV